MRQVLAYLCVAIAINSVAATHASAEMSYAEFKSKGLDNDEVGKIWIGGIYNGAEWSNTMRKVGGEKKLFCTPEKLAMTNEQVASIVDQYIKDNPQSKDLPMGLVVLNAARYAFPCEAS